MTLRAKSSSSLCERLESALATLDPAAVTYYGLLREAADLLASQEDQIRELEKEIAILKLAVPLEEDLAASIDEMLKYLAMEDGYTLNGIARLLVECQRRMAADWLEVGGARRQLTAIQGERDEAMKEIERCLSPGNQNVINGDLVGSVRDMAQVYVTSKGNAEDAMRQWEADRALTAIIQRERDEHYADAQRQFARANKAEAELSTVREALKAIVDADFLKVAGVRQPIWVRWNHALAIAKAALQPSKEEK